MRIRTKFASMFILCMILASLMLVQGTSSEAVWPNLGNDLQNSSRSTSDTSHLDGTLLWKLDTNVSNHGKRERVGPVIDDEDLIYFGSGNPVPVGINDEYEGALFAVNPNGSIEWKLDINRTTRPFGRESAIYSPAIGSDGMIYCVGSDLHSVSRQGKLRWSSDQTTRVLTSYAISFEEGVLLFTGDTFQNLLNFVSYSGEPLWNFTVYTHGDDEVEYSTARPAIDSQGIIYMGVGTFNATTFRDRKGYLYAINEGEQIWRRELVSGVNSVVLGDDENIYVGCDDGELYAFDKNGVEQWTYNHTDSIITLSLGIDDTIYSTSNNGTLMAFGSDVELKWNLNLHNETDIFASLAVGSEGTVYAGSWHEESEHTELYAVSSDGTLLWNYTLDSMPVGGVIGSDGTLYVLSKEGILYAFGGEKMDESWQTFLIVGVVIVGALVAVYLLFKYRRRTQQHSNESRKRGDI